MDANVFYACFAPNGIDMAQVHYWKRAISAAMQGDAIKKEVQFNRWTRDLIGHKELPGYLGREIDTYRKTLKKLGL